MTPRSIFGECHCFGGTLYLYLQGRSVKDDKLVLLYRKVAEKVTTQKHRNFRHMGTVRWDIIPNDPFN
jgi:hypothetical protein